MMVATNAQYFLLHRVTRPDIVVTNAKCFLAEGVTGLIVSDIR